MTTLRNNNLDSYLMASSIVSGRVSPRVSGKNIARTPAVVATQPMINTGAGNQKTCKICI